MPSAWATRPMAALTRYEPVPACNIIEPMRQTASDASARFSSRAARFDGLIRTPFLGYDGTLGLRL